MGTTSDRSDPRISYGVDEEPTEMSEVYMVMSEEDRAKGFVRPYRDRYQHIPCGVVTTMGRSLSETYAANPSFYGATWCVQCQMHRPVGEHGEFLWIERDGSTGPMVGT